MMCFVTVIERMVILQKKVIELMLITLVQMLALVSRKMAVKLLERMLHWLLSWTKKKASKKSLGLTTL